MSNSVDHLQPGVTVSIVSDAGGLDRISVEWRELLDRSPAASPPLRLQWVRQWWNIYGPVYGDAGTGLRILELRRKNRLIGVLPLYVRSHGVPGCRVRELSFISHGAAEFEETTTTNVDLLCAAEDAHDCMEAVLRELQEGTTLQWDRLSLQSLSRSSPLAAVSNAMFSHRQVARVREDCSYLFDMNGGFERYVERLSKENRRQARKMIRDADAGGLRLELATSAEQANQFFDEMVALHRTRWNSKGREGSFAPRHARFHRALACDGVAAGQTILGRLTSGQDVLAVIYAHRAGPTVFCYQQGVDTSRQQAVRSPGTAAWLMLMRIMAGQGVTSFDHQTGKTEFKHRYSTGTHNLVDISLEKTSWRTAAHRSVDMARRAVRKSWGVARKYLGQSGSRPNGQVPAGSAANDKSPQSLVISAAAATAPADGFTVGSTPPACVGDSQE